MLKKEKTKAELIEVIRGKLKGLKPHQRAFAMSGLKYNKKAVLKSRARLMKVEKDKDGFDVLWYGK